MTITLDPSDLAGTRTSLGVGDAATKTVGTANGNLIAADATGLPAINGSQVTALNAAALTGSVADARLPAAIQGFPAPGASGNTLQSDGSNWTSAAASGGGGGLELIGTASASNSTLLEFTGLTTDFDAFRIIGSELTCNLANATSITILYGTSAGYINDTQYEGTEVIWENGVLVDHVSSGQAFMCSNAPIQSGDNGFFSFDYMIQRSINKWGPNLFGSWVARKSTNSTRGGLLFQSHRNINDNAGNAMTKIKVAPTQGNFPTGRVTLFGVKHA